jgi:hypothetical protein
VVTGAASQEGLGVWRSTASNDPRFQLPTPEAGVYFARSWNSDFSVSRRLVLVR